MSKHVAPIHYILYTGGVWPVWFLHYSLNIRLWYYFNTPCTDKRLVLSVTAVTMCHRVSRNVFWQNAVHLKQPNCPVTFTLSTDSTDNHHKHILSNGWCCLLKLATPGYQGFSSRRGHGSSVICWISWPTLIPLQSRIHRLPGCEADQAPASHAEDVNKWSCTVLPIRLSFTSCITLPLLSCKLF